SLLRTAQLTHRRRRMSHDLFTPRSQQDLERLITEYPLAWVVSPGADVRATLLPLQAVKDAGRMTGLMGHFARSNPQVQLLQREPRALILFLGTQGYISPSWMTDRTRAPTWNYVSAQFIVDLSEEHTSALQSLMHVVCRFLPEIV